MATRLLSGNEAIARGAYEAGVRVGTGYPGTPSTEILEAAVRFPDIYCQWSPNEKTALEVAAGASLAGARSMVTMKHVGLNVASDPLMTLAYLGVVGGMVVVVADDPGMHSSQNEQDSRHYARFAKVPMFEPSDSQEAKDFVGLAMEVSERFETPVILRTTTRVSHSRSIVELGERPQPQRAIGFAKDPQRFVPVPMYGRRMRVRLEERLGRLKEYAEAAPCNRVIGGSDDLGIVTSSISYHYAAEVFPDASFLKLGMSHPFPERMVRDFARGVKRLLVVEELDDIFEQEIRALGVAVVGRELIPGIGELDPDRLARAKAVLSGGRWEEPKTREPAALPGRPPVLCPGCPHRGLFYALKEFNVVVTGDIGCYSLAVFAPLERMDTILCMGAGITMALGMAKAGLTDQKIVGVVGDSTFFHSGITGLLDVAYNKGNVTIIVLDNRATAMTGHQDHPGTGRTLSGEPTGAASIEAFGRACGIRRVRTVDPNELERTREVLAEELAADEPSLIVSRAACRLLDRAAAVQPRRIDPELCQGCGLCAGSGCPAIEVYQDADGRELYRIDPALCAGCSLCEQICRFDAVQPVGADR